MTLAKYIMFIPCSGAAPNKLPLTVPGGNMASAKEKKSQVKFIHRHVEYIDWAFAYYLFIPIPANPPTLSLSAL